MAKGWSRDRWILNMRNKFDVRGADVIVVGNGYTAEAYWSDGKHSSGNSYDLLQKIIDNLPAGTIKLAGRFLLEHGLVIDNADDLKIVGKNYPKLEFYQHTEENMIYITGSNRVRIEGLEVNPNGYQGTTDYGGIFAYDGYFAEIIGNRVHNSSHGNIKVHDMNARIVMNEVWTDSDTDFGGTAYEDNIILYATGWNNIFIFGNFLHDSLHANSISLTYDCHSVLVYGNVIRTLRGMGLEYGNTNEYYGVQILGNIFDIYAGGDGIKQYGGTGGYDGVVIANNRVYMEGGGNALWVYQNTASNWRIVDNIIYGGDRGVWLEQDVSDFVIERNIFQKQGTMAIQVDAGFSGIIKDNVFKDVAATQNIYTQNSGTDTQSGDGTTTQFTIAHGLSAQPSKVVVTPASADASGDFYVTVDSTNIYINYKTAPPSGTNNLSWYWEAEV